MKDTLDTLAKLIRRGPSSDPVTPANWARKQVEAAWPDIAEMERIALRLRIAGVQP